MNESVTGYIDHVIFRNEENGYTVMILKGVDGEEEIGRASCRERVLTSG